MTYQTEYARNNTGGSGTPVFAYTAMLGNGVTATLSIEDYTERRANVVPVIIRWFRKFHSRRRQHSPSTTATRRRTSSATCASIRLGARRRSPARCISTRRPITPLQPAGTVTAHPDDKWGWAVGAGILLKMPWDAKDTFAVAGHYCEGATTYCVNVPGSYGARSSGASLFQDGGVAVGWWDDAYFATNAANRGQLELPKVWSVQAGFQHYWTNSLRSSIWGSYMSYEANSNAVDTIICAPTRLRRGLRGLERLAGRLSHDLESGDQPRYRS